MSLYYVQKLLYNLNRDPRTQEMFKTDIDALLDEYKLTDEERGWLKDGNVGELYIHGVNGQILMHFAALIGQEWDEYIQAMKDGLAEHGQVRGVFYLVHGLVNSRVFHYVLLNECSSRSKLRVQKYDIPSEKESFWQEAWHANL